MTKDVIEKILCLLDENYPNLKCYLNYKTDWQLLIATILSAQCTDDRVNIVTETLFVKYKTLDDFANVSQDKLEQDIKSTGFYRNKARNIILSSNQLIHDYAYKMPSSIEELTKLAGVGRKTANVIRNYIFDIPSIVVDTHVKRISNKLGLTDNVDPEKIEYDLMKLLPEDHWLSINLQLIAHGRKICKARKPNCSECFLNSYCRGKM